MLVSRSSLDKIPLRGSKKKKPPQESTKRSSKKPLKDGVVPAKQPAPKTKKSRGLPAEAAPREKNPDPVIQRTVLPPATAGESISGLIEVLKSSRLAHQRARGLKLEYLVGELRQAGDSEEEILPEVRAWLTENP